MLAPRNPEVDYYKHPALAFRQGQVVKVGKKRHSHAYYWRYHFFLPRTTAPVLRLLKKYFYHLDSEQSVPVDHRIRQTKWECVETAINILAKVRMASLGSSPSSFVMGSDHICPVAWAVIGSEANNPRIGQNRFTSVTDVFERYDSLMWAGGFNTVAIDRPLSHEKNVDKLRILLNTYQQTANYIVAAALFLLHDLVLNGGPDCFDFYEAFSNDKRSCSSADETAWLIARQAVVGTERKNLDVFTGLPGALLSRKSGRAIRSRKIPYQYSVKHRSVEIRRTYWDVTLTEKKCKKGDPLTSGERVSRHKPKKKKNPPLPAVRPKHTSAYDREEDSTLEPINPIYEAMKNHIPSMSQDTEIYSGWSGLS